MTACLLHTAAPEAGARGACPGETSPTAAAAATELRAAVLCLVNVTRLERGLLPLRHDSRLERSAQAHADDMVARGYVSHVSPEGTLPGERIAATGYPGTLMAENVAQFGPTSVDIVRSWLQSDSHCRTILAWQFRDLGVGVNPGVADPRFDAGTWVQHFGLQRDVPPPPALTGPEATCPQTLSPITPGLPPDEVATEVANVTSTTATLAAAIDPRGQFTSYHFELGGSPAYTTATVEQAASNGAPVIVATTMDGLAPSTTYHYRVVAMNATGEAAGGDGSFRTAPRAEPADGAAADGAGLGASPPAPPAEPVVSSRLGAVGADGIVRVRLNLAPGVRPGRAQVRIVSLSRPRTTLARGSFRSRPGRHTVRLRLTAAGRRSLRGGRSTAALLRVRPAGRAEAEVEVRRVRLRR